VQETNQPEEEILIDDSNQLDNDLLKEKLKEKYDSFFKNSNQEMTLTSTKYHILTNNYFKDKLKTDEVNNLIQYYNRNEFELFWSEVQQLKDDLRACGRLKH